MFFDSNFLIRMELPATELQCFNTGEKIHWWRRPELFGVNSMIKNFYYSTLFLIAAYFFWLTAPGCNGVGSDKIAFVDSKEIISESEGGKLATAKLQSFAQIKKAANSTFTAFQYSYIF